MIDRVSQTIILWPPISRAGKSIEHTGVVVLVVQGCGVCLTLLRWCMNDLNEDRWRTWRIHVTSIRFTSHQCLLDRLRWFFVYRVAASSKVCPTFPGTIPRKTIPQCQGTAGVLPPWLQVCRSAKKLEQETPYQNCYADQRYSPRQRSSNEQSLEAMKVNRNSVAHNSTQL